MFWRTASSSTPDLDKVDVVPINAIDFEARNQSMVMHYAFTFDGKLDPGKLRDSLNVLVEKKFRIVGTRLARNVKTNAVEFHVPKRFDQDIPPFTFTSASHDSPMEAHVPRPQSKISPDETEITTQELGNPLWTYSGFDPTLSVETYADKPLPIFTVHVCTFQDKTLVGVAMPHLLCDVRGLSIIMNAWSTVLSKGIDAVPESPLYHDLIGRIGRDVEPVPLVGRSIYSFWEKTQFIARIVWELIWASKEARRYIHFPNPIIDKMRSEAVKELEKAGTPLPLTKNDILTAWHIKASLDTYAGHDAIPVGAAFAVDFRTRLPDVFVKPYIHNTADFVPVYPWLAVGDIKSSSLAHIASRVHATVKSLTPEKLKPHTAWRLQDRSVDGVSFPHDGTFCVLTSWRNSNLEEVDFSPALTEGSSGSGRLEMLSPNTGARLPFRRAASLNFEDSTGVWMVLGMASASWDSGMLGALKRV